MKKKSSKRHFSQRIIIIIIFIEIIPAIFLNLATKIKFEIGHITKTRNQDEASHKASLTRFGKFYSSMNRLRWWNLINYDLHKKTDENEKGRTGELGSE